MGRAGRGGGGGGGGFRSSGFGGSRGFGSHSGGSSSHRSSFSSSSRSSHSSGSSYHHHYNSGPKFYYFGGTRYSGSSGYSGGYTNNSYTTRNRSKSPLSKIIWLAILLIVMASVLLPDSKGSSGAGTGGSITKSTVNRERFDSSSYTKSDVYYRDELDWIKNPAVLKKGMEHFYDKTGVQPFLFITDNIGKSGYASDAELEEFGNSVYDKYFDDECHLVVVFYEKDGKYRSFYVTGTQAKTVIDDEAGEILLDYIDHYYYSDYEESEFFSRSFSEAADRIMRVTPNYMPVIIIFIIITVIVIILFKWWKKKKQHKLDEMKQAQDILNSDLNEFGGADYTGYGSSSSVDDLKKKYDN